MGIEIKKVITTERTVICDKCNHPITEEKRGFVVLGNIYDARPLPDDNPKDEMWFTNHGVIGDNFPHEFSDDTNSYDFSVEEIHPSCYHLDCLIEILRSD